MFGKGGFPLVMVILGLVISLGVFVALMAFAFTWIDLTFYLPALALAGFFFFYGKAKLKKK